MSKYINIMKSKTLSETLKHITLYYNIVKGEYFIIALMLQQYCSNISQCFSNIVILQ